MISSNYKAIIKHTCMDCVFFKHDGYHNYCSHAKANEEEKSYRYYNFKCEDEFKFEPKEIVKRIYDNL